MEVASMSAYRPRDDYSQSYHQPYAYYQARAYQPHSDVATSAGPNLNPYASYQAMPPQQQQHPQRPSLSPRSSSSTSVGEDGSKPSLPSISNLLDIAADGERSTHNSPTNAQSQPNQQQPQMQQAQQQPATQAMDQRYRQSRPMPELPSSRRTAVPPTPPLRSDSVVEGTNSPSTISTGSSISAPPYFVDTSLNTLDPHEQRMAAAHLLKQRHSIPSQPGTSPYGASSYTTSPYTTSPYTASPGGMSSSSFYSPNQSYSAATSMTGMYHQRSLPSNFPPPAPIVVSNIPSNLASNHPSNIQSNIPSGLPTTNPWEHHHYISASSQATFPQSQDRYICQTCNKAFSRPSSLKIHSHSHTGEKPFKCPHAGCGKAFSVRSNMKRHERGCHTGLGCMGAAFT